MNGKKNELIAISKKRNIFLNIGLIIAISLCITAFEWKFSGTEITFSTIEDIPETVTFFPPVMHPEVPAPIKKKKLNTKASTNSDIEILNNNTKIDNTKKEKIDTFSYNNDPIIIDNGPDEKTEFVIYAEHEALPLIGINKFRTNVQKELAKNLNNRDKQLINDGITIYLEFIIEKNGSLSNVKILKGFTSNINKSAMKAVRKSGKWEAAMSQGKKVRQKKSFPIRIHF